MKITFSSCDESLPKPSLSCRGSVTCETELHETLEIHELLTFKTNCALKSAMMESMVSDDELKEILLEDVRASQSAIQELKQLLINAEY